MSCKELEWYVSKTKIFVWSMYIKMKGVPFVSFLLDIFDSMPRGHRGEIPFRVNRQTPTGLVENRVDDGVSKDTTSVPSQVADVGQTRSGSEVRGEGDSRERGAFVSPPVERSAEPVVEQRRDSTMVLDSAEAGPSRDGASSLDEVVYRRILEGLRQYEGRVNAVRGELGALVEEVEELREQSGMR